MVQANKKLGKGTGKVLGEAKSQLFCNTNQILRLNETEKVVAALVTTNNYTAATIQFLVLDLDYL